MIFWYLNKQTNKWSEVDLNDDFVKKYNVKPIEIRTDIPNHEGLEIPVMGYVNSAPIETDTVDYQSKPRLEHTCYVNGTTSVDGVDTYVAIPIRIEEVSVDPNSHDNYEFNGNERPVLLSRDSNSIPTNGFEVFQRLNALNDPLPVQSYQSLGLGELRYNRVTIDTKQALELQYPMTDASIEFNRKMLKSGQPIEERKVKAKTYDEKFHQLTKVDGHKVQKSKYFTAKGNKGVLKYINRDGLSVVIEKKLGGGYKKTIGVGFDKDGHILEVLGTKQVNTVFKNSFGAKSKYTSDERTNIESWKNEIKNRTERAYEVISKSYGPSIIHWDPNCQSEKRLLSTANVIHEYNPANREVPYETNQPINNIIDTRVDQPITAPTFVLTHHTI